ncbi:MAG TPA: PKD domain-containing protein [Patescibacteria group bacterium]|nr:PKD domain-containing protein [Patescibacteria group bacterium]
MNLLKNIRDKVINSSKKAKVLLATVTATAVLTGVVSAGWSPDRPVFDWNNPAERKGSLDGPRMNAFVNTPYYGNERAFFDARKPGENTSKDIYTSVTQGEKEVILRTYVHNGANQETNASGVGMAKDAKVRVDLPTGTSKALRARSYISISNPAPNYPAEVTDTAELVDNIPFSIKYVPGSAKIFNSAHPNGAALSDTIVGSGAPIGHDSMNGNVPGCFEYQATVEIRVKIEVPDTDISKQVKKAGTDGNYGELATVKPGEKVQWLIRQDNKGSATQNNVQVFDALPDHLEVVPGSVKWVYKGANGQDQNVQMNDTDLFTKLVDFGTWDANTFFYLVFETKAKGDFEGCEILLTNQARSKSKQRPEEQRDNAQVKIVKEDCEPAKPKYACDLLKAEVLNEKKREVRFTADASASGGATIERYRFTFGDGKDLTTDQNVVTHTYEKDGQYVARVAVEVRVGNEIKVAESESCEVVLTFDDKPETPPVTPPTTPQVPGKLPETGPSEVILAFLAVTVGSSITYLAIVRRLAGLA